MDSTDRLIAITEADKLYRERARPESGRSSVSLLERVAGTAGDYDVQWRLARAMFLAGQDDPMCSRQGASHGLVATSLNADGVEGHFWAGVNLALSAEQLRGIRGALLLLKARKHLKRAVAISESYHGAGPLRVLGRLYHKAPRLLGGSLTRSRSCYDRAVELAPSNPVTLVYAAELAIDCGELSRAVTLLTRLEEIESDPDWAFELGRDKIRARELLATIGRDNEGERPAATAEA